MWPGLSAPHVSFFSLCMTWFSYLWNQIITQSMPWAVIGWWALKGSEQTFSRGVLGWEINSPSQTPVCSALVYIITTHRAPFPHWRVLLRSLSNSWHAFPLGSGRRGSSSEPHPLCGRGQGNSFSFSQPVPSSVRWDHASHTEWLRKRDNIATTSLHVTGQGRTRATENMQMGNLKEHVWS